jgi:microcin C transport system substrate-binding protein
LKVLGAAGATAGLNLPAVSRLAAAEDGWRHGLSLFGALKYPAGFQQFDYVNTDAPQGGTVRMSAVGSFDSLNLYSFKGEKAGLVGLTSETLMTSALDEASTEYGLIAELVRHPDDFSSVEFRLRQEARFHDGSPVTAEDVIWSLNAVKEAHPQYAFYYQNIVKAEQTGDHQVLFAFSEKGNRELPQITGQLPVLSKAWWSGKTADGKQRDIMGTTLEPPLGSGPYKVSDVKQGQSITVERVADYWGRDLPVQRGQNNFDKIVQLYYRDTTVAFEGFKADQYDWRREVTAKVWATGYDFPAVNSGKVVLEKIELKNPESMQAFVFNTRLDKFKDPRVRRAFNYAFDFEWSNENLFYSQYKRTSSFFEKSELAATGVPEGAELAILEPYRDRLPPELFTTPYSNPVSNGPQDRRSNLREAFKLLREAGWSAGSDRMLVNGKGEAFEVELLLYWPTFERIVLPYAEQLKKLGINARVRTIDSAQYERRTQNFDFDIIVGGWGQSLSPGNEQRDYWGSAAADRPGSRNETGIKNPIVDELIERLIYAKDRADLVAATRALDRVLLWHHYVVPMWHIPYERTARWDRLSRPDRLPDYSIGFPSIWWWDDEKAAKVKAG